MRKNAGPPKASFRAVSRGKSKLEIICRSADCCRSTLATDVAVAVSFVELRAKREDPDDATGGSQTCSTTLRGHMFQTP